MAEEDTQGAIPPKQTPPAPPAAPAAGSPIARKPVIMRKPTLRKPGEAAPAPAPAPAAPAVPAPSAPAPQGITIPREEAAKKMTARISLASATGQIPSVAIPSQTDDVKTIKLKAPTVAIPAMPEQDSAAIAAQAAKSKTSRISLEAAFSTQPELPAGESTPKTIRLKRPTEMGGAPAKPPLKPPTTHIQLPPTPHQTGQIPPASVAAPPSEAAESADSSLTRKKTIKVKRPGAGGGPKISLNKGEGGDAAPGDDDNLQQLTGFDNLTPIAGPDKVNPIFLVAAVVAILVAIDLIWVLAAQLFGPNAASADFTKAQGPNVPNPPFALVVE